MVPKLSILIATLGRRHDKFKVLLDNLMPYVNTFRGEVEVVAYWNNGELAIGEYRQTLLEAARGEYICFVDDDDKLPDYYCEKIMDALGKDYIGFRVKVFNNEVEHLPAEHSIRHPGWYQDEHGYYRGVTHLNPIKRAIALKGTFLMSSGEDEQWAREVCPYVKTENFINDYMYYYLHDTSDTAFGGDKEKEVHAFQKLDYENLRYVARKI